MSCTGIGSGSNPGLLEFRLVWQKGAGQPYLIYGVLKTRQPFDANWANKATEAIEVAVAVVVPLRITTATLDFKYGI